MSLLRKEITQGGVPPDQWLPEAHTCTLELELPDYSSRDVLQRQLAVALDDMKRGGGFALL